MRLSVGAVPQHLAGARPSVFVITHDDGAVQMVASNRREGDAAVADQRLRDAMPGRRPQQRIPADLGIQVRVQIDESK